MKYLLLLLGLFAWGFGLNGQKISNEKIFPVDYPIMNIGYPSKMVPNTDGSFIYLEYWPQSPGGKKVAGYYLQSYDKAYKEEWSMPLTKQGTAPVKEVIDLVRFDQSVGVLAYQFSPSIKRDQVKMQVFSLDGQPIGGLQTVSSYTKKEKKDYVDEFAFSENQSKMLWLGHNPTASAKSRQFFCSVWDGQGKKVWGKKLFLPHIEEDKYLVKQATVDNRGNAYFLLNYEEMTNTEKDTAFKPVVVRYDYRENKYTEHTLNFPNASVQESRIYVTSKGDLAFLGVLSDGSGKGFMNGAKRFETALSWDQIVFQRYDIQRELRLSAEYTMDFPEAWLKTYKERGANFSRGEVVEAKGKLYWILEEFYTQIHGGQPQYLFYDVATVAIDIESGNAAWATTFTKKQRDYKSGRLLSYVRGMAGNELHFVYLNERGAQGKIVCTSLNLADGSVRKSNLAANERATYLFFPARSTMVDEGKMILMGVGNPVGNDYKLIEVSF